MNGHAIRICAIAFVGSLSSAPLEAQRMPDPWRFRAAAGVDALMSDDGRATIRPVVHVGAERVATRHISVGLGGDYMIPRTFRAANDQVGDATGTGSRTEMGSISMVNRVRADMPSGQVFGLAGIGLNHVRTVTTTLTIDGGDQRRVFSQTGPMATVGTGYSFTGRQRTVFVEVRYSQMIGEARKPGVSRTWMAPILVGFQF